jgi:hypothetical protein
MAETTEFRPISAGKPNLNRKKNKRAFNFPLAICPSDYSVRRKPQPSGKTPSL